jgi:hypothetical protein
MGSRPNMSSIVSSTLSSILYALLKRAIKLKKLFTIGLQFMAMSFSLAHADNLPLKTLNGVELGVQFSNYKYEERVNGNFFMSNEGSKFGLIGNITRALNENWYLVGDGRYASGSVNYTGSGTKGGNPDVLIELRLTAGRDFVYGNYLLFPYAGLGYRNLANDLRGTSSTGANGYRRESTYTYFPLGLTHRFILDEQSRISSSLEYDYLIEGTQISRLSDTQAGSNDIRNAQKNGFGIRFNTNYETLRWSFGVFYQFWNIGDSDIAIVTLNGTPIGTGMEPKNSTNELGVQFKYRF